MTSRKVLSTALYNTGIGTRASDRQVLAADQRINSPYTVLLREPMSSIAANVPDRPDLRSVSILGYN